MPRISPVDSASASPAIQATFSAIKSKIGMVPNLFKTFARSPSVLDGYLGFSDTLSKGLLDAKQREVVALAVAQANECHYCISAHTAIGKGAGLTSEEMHKARAGQGLNARDGAIAAFAKTVVATHGRVSDADIAKARNAGLNDDQLVEIIANVALNVLTNYTNNVAQTDIDFPKVDLALGAAA